MIEALFILRWPLLLLAGVSLSYWLLVLVRIRRALSTAPPVRAGLDAPPPREWPRVSVIVPAHNEATVIEPCVGGLRAQDYPNLEIIFVLDRCTDDTLRRLRSAAEDDRRVIVIENDSCPADWAGKCNAARVGAARATGDWLLFTDADTRFDPALVRASMGMALTRDLEFVSLLSTLTTNHRFERIVQPAASMTLMRMYPIDLVNRGESRRRFANGQFMLFSRPLYQRIGGHNCVRHDLLEDMSFARHVRRHHGRSGVFPDGGMLVCAMYDSYEGFREGWKRIFIEAGKRKPSRLRRIALRVGAAAIAEPLLRALTVAVGAGLIASGSPAGGGILLGLGIAGFAAKVGALSWIYRVGRTPFASVFAQPIGAWQVARIMSAAASDLENRRPVQWGGRQYVLEPRAPDAPRPLTPGLHEASH